jgi:hypothetical protein
MPMSVATADMRRRDTTAARLAAQATFAQRRAHKALVELDKQEYIVLPPGTRLPPELADLVVRP